MAETGKTFNISLPPFSAQRPRREPSPKPVPAGCLFSTRKTRSEVPERGDLGEDFCLGRGGGWTGQKKEKRMHKKRWDEFG